MSFIDHETAYRLELCHAMRSYYYAEAYSRLRPEAPVEMVQLGGGVVMYRSPGSDLNRAMALGFSPEDALRVIEQVEDYYRQRGEPACFEVSPLAERAFFKTLCRRGYQLDGFLNVLACRIPSQVAEIAPPPGVVVRRVAPEEGERWIETVAKGWEEVGLTWQDELEFTAPNFYSRIAECYLAWVDGEPAGGGGMYAYQGAVELGSASTRPAFRRRGVQTALLLRRLHDAQAAGYDLALATTRPGSDSQRNLERIGMRVAYTKVRVKSSQ